MRSEWPSSAAEATRAARIVRRPRRKATPPTTPSSCEAPLTDLGGGWEKCSNGLIHRRALGTCASSVPRADTLFTGSYYSADAGYPYCLLDSDCTDQPYGHCERALYPPTACRYGCVTNADCDPGSACLCNDPVGYCFPADCATDADCGAGFLCSEVRNGACGGTKFTCQVAADSCAVDSDCYGGERCALGVSNDGTPLRQCSSFNCPVP